MRVELYPVFAIAVRLDHFRNVELAHRGYYQVRVRLKSPSTLCAIDVRVEKSSEEGGVMGAAQLLDGQAVSKTIEVVFADEGITLDDCFCFSVRACKRLDHLSSLSLHMAIELWFLDRDRPPRLESFRFLSRRIFTIELNLGCSLHCYRSLLFDYYNLAGLSFALHASLVSVLPRRRKSSPVPMLNDKLRNYYRSVCRTLLGSCSSLQRFIHKYCYLLNFSIENGVIDSSVEEEKLMTALEISQSPWSLLEENVTGMSCRLTTSFNQLIQMFDSCTGLDDVMFAEHCHLRLKRLAEGFFFSEEPIHSLLSEKPSDLFAVRVADLMKKTGYIGLMQPLAVNCSTLDGDAQNGSIIVEQRLLPSINVPRLVLPSIVAEKKKKKPEEEDDDHDHEDLTGSGSHRPKKKNKKPEEEDDDHEDLSGSGSHQPNNGDSDRLLAIDESPIPAEQNKVRRKLSGFCLPLKSVTNDNGDDDVYKKSATIDNLNVYCKERRLTDPFATDQTGNGLLVSNNCSKHHRSRSSNDVPRLFVNEKNNDQAIATEGTSTPSSSVSTEDVSSSFSDGTISDQMLAFVRGKESFKLKLHGQLGYTGYLYSDAAQLLSQGSSQISESKRSNGGIHLVVFVHGLEGGCDDLAPYRNYLRLALPDANMKFLMSECNQTETWTDLGTLAENLHKELLAFYEQLPESPERISFVAHSMGGVIVRAMVPLLDEKLAEKLFTLMTLNSPHCGLLYNQRAANWGVTLVQWWKQSASLEQLTLRDRINFRETFLYRLSQNKALARFRHVLMVGSSQDLYVPCHSALLEPCKMATKDPSMQGTVYNEMLMNIAESLVASPVRTVLVRYTAFHSYSNVSRTHQMTGRAAHIAVLDDDLFIEKLVSVSASKYFR